MTTSVSTCLLCGEAPHSPRMSALPQLEYCGYVGQLSFHHPESSIYTLKGDAFHAGAAAAERREPVLMEMYQAAIGALDEVTRAEVADMLGRWMEVRKEIAPEHIDVETTLAIDREGMSCAPDAPGALVGHADASWLDQAGAACVLDFKTGQPRDYELQLAAYGLAYSSLKGTDRFTTGVAYVKAGQTPEIKWSPVYTAETSEVLWRRILSAWDRSPHPVTGPHCADCFQRTHCVAHLAPAMELAHDALRPFMQRGGLTRANASRALSVYKSMQDVMKIAKAQLESFADQQDGIVDGGKVWRGREMQGASRVDVEALRRDGLYEKYARKGEPYRTYGWSNLKKGDAK